MNARILKALAIAVGIAIPAEGLRQVAYKDPVGVLTVCYGTTGDDVKSNRVYSLKQCKAMLNRDMLKAIEAVDKCAPGLPDNTLAAFADAVYNLGTTIVCDTKKSTAARMLRSGDIAGACNQLPRWSFAKVGGVSVALPGLIKRRERERVLCLG